MSEFDDFEIVDEEGLLDEPVFELIDVDGAAEKHPNPKTPSTSDLVLPFLIPTPLVEETAQMIEQQKSKPVFNTPEPEEPPSPVQTTITVTSFIPIKPTIVHPPPPARIFVPVPPLPKAPPLRRYGAAALIPHTLDMPLDVNTIIDKSKQNQQRTLQMNTQQQQDIQTVLEQRQKLLNKKNF